MLLQILNKWVIKLFEKIEKCQKCDLYHNQKPLLDKVRTADIMVVGISAKRVHDEKEVPLDAKTKSGQIVSMLEAKALKNGYSIYRTNLVKCVPLNSDGEIRYPNKEEIIACMDNFFVEYECVTPKLIILLGNQVKEAVERHFNVKLPKAKNCEFLFQKVDKYMFVTGYHPSYIMRSKRKTELYLNNFEKMLKQFEVE